MIRETVSGVLRSNSQATAILHELEAAGFDDTDILVLFQSRGAKRAPILPRDLPDALARLSPVGATVGGVVGLLTGVGAVAVLGIGPRALELPLLAMTLGATAVGASAGAQLGTRLSRLMRDARERRRTRQSLLLSVYTETPSQAEAARRILETHAASDVAVEDARA
jgi:hypothetical protein